MDVDRIRPLRPRLCDEPSPGLLVARIVGVLSNGHSEDVAESRPVGHIPSLIKHCWKQLGKDAQFTLLAYEEHVGELLDGNAVDFALVFENAPVNGVVVFTVDEVVSDEALVVAPELHEREAVELRQYTILSELLEPWRAYLRVDFLIRLAVALELDGYARDPTQSFSQHAREMKIEQCRLVHVVESYSVRIVDALCRLDRSHVGRHVEEEDLWHL